jgi:hypothetical protein
VTLPKGARLLPSKWVYNLKQNGNFKARPVACGDKQHPGQEFSLTFANVVSPETLHHLFALFTLLDWEAHCVDIMTAFLLTLMDPANPTYLKRPPRYEAYNAKGRLHVWLLLHAIYGLKQAN